MLKHSIIIPNRSRNRVLYHCVWSIARSARLCGIPDDAWELVIVDHYSWILPTVPAPCRTIVCTDPPGILNKPKLLNIGVSAATGDILSFVDADMLVGERWMRAAPHAMDRNPPTRLAYRVRQLKLSENAHRNEDIVCKQLELTTDKDAVLDGWFGDYKTFTRGFEAYVEPEAGNKPPEEKTPVFGNSQFSVRRDVLGDLRFDEGFPGAGYEDIWMAWAQEQQAGNYYRGAIYTDAKHGMLHIWHGSRSNEEPLSDWDAPGMNYRNEQRYYAYKWPEGRLTLDDAICTVR